LLPEALTLGVDGQPPVVDMYMKPTNIHLREDHLKRLKAISDQTGVPVSALIRKAIEEYLKKK